MDIARIQAATAILKSSIRFGQMLAFSRQIFFFCHVWSSFAGSFCSSSIAFTRFISCTMEYWWMCLVLSGMGKIHWGAHPGARRVSV